MKILVIGSGGREHALVWSIAQSKLVDKIFCAPGNGGTQQHAENIDIKADDIFGLLEFAKKEKIGLTVVGPEAPLAAGIVDEFHKYKLKIFGPNKAAARLEASKVFSKSLMAKYKVPTANFKVFNNAPKAKEYIAIKGAPCVVKADGLAAGKGVVVAKTVEEASRAVDAMLEDGIFGEAGKRIIIEDCLEGQEASILVITDSRQAVVLASAQDHKRIFDNDQGPNTGGMGVYSPAPVVTGELLKEILDRIIYRTIDGLAKEGIEYKGVLYAGVMITKDGPKALEFNVRFGDPETQAILPRLKSDLVEIMLASCDGKLSRLGPLEWDERACVCVVLASKGYPGEYASGKEIFGLNKILNDPDIMIFHSGTRKDGERVLTIGGRVLGVCGLGKTIKEAVDCAYQEVGTIIFDGMHYRKDIGKRAIS